MKLTLFSFCWYYQGRTNDWSKTSLRYTSEKASRLPIIDVAIKDIGQSDQEFAIEIGSVCFQTQNTNDY